MAVRDNIQYWQYCVLLCVVLLNSITSDDSNNINASNVYLPDIIQY